MPRYRRRFHYGHRRGRRGNQALKRWSKRVRYGLSQTGKQFKFDVARAGAKAVFLPLRFLGRG